MSERVGVRERASDIGWKIVAGGVLLIAGWILLKIVLGFLAWVATVIVVIAAAIAVLWALNRLL